MRESWRLQKTTLQRGLTEQNKQLHVFFIYTGRIIPDYKDVLERSGKVIDKLSNMLVAKK